MIVFEKTYPVTRDSRTNRLIVTANTQFITFIYVYTYIHIDSGPITFSCTKGLKIVFRYLRNCFSFMQSFTRYLIFSQ